MVKRYDPDIEYQKYDNQKPVMLEIENGDYVSYQDYLEAIKAEREECATVCDELAEKYAIKIDDLENRRVLHNDEIEISNLKASAWLIKVIAATIRNRSNES